jgi:hypothetical protein
VLAEMGVAIHRFSLADFESPSAGLPAVRLVEAYLGAAIESPRETPSALLIEDIDLALGRGGDGAEVIQRTMNRDLVIGTLMSLCDSPSRVKIPVESQLPDNGRFRICYRTPIIITGNNLRHIYRPLFRHGRARLVSWAPAESTRVRYVSHLFKIDLEHAASLVREFKDEPMSFWSSVSDELHRSRVLGAVEHVIRATATVSLAQIHSHLGKATPEGRDIRSLAQSVQAGREGLHT